MDLRMEQKAERRERILDAAREMIGERGYEALTMRDLARAARVTVPTIYNLIGGKQAVLFAAIEEQTAQFVAGLHTAEPEGPAAHAIAVIESCSREMLRLPAYYRSLLTILLTSDAARDMRVLVDRALSGELEAALGGMQQAGDLEPWADTKTLARSLTGHFQFTALRWAAGELDAAALNEASVYGAGLMLLAVARGDSREILFERVRASQERLGVRTDRRRSARAGRSRS